MSGRFLVWAAALAAGQAAHLRLIDAGPRIHFQHMLPPRELWTGEPWALAWLAAQAAAVAIALVRTGLPRMPARAWVLIAAALALFGATVQADARLFVVDWVLSAALGALHLATVYLAARAFPRALFDAGGALFRRVPLTRLAWVGAALVTMVAAFLAVVVYENHPHVPDEVCYVLQARYFAAGMLAMPAPPVPDAFHVELMIVEPSYWYSCFPPGWPAVLAIGMLLGVPWLVNPVLAGVNILLLARLLRALYDEPVARLGTLLCCASPWYVFLGMSFMSHQLSLTCALAGALAAERVRRTQGAGWAAACGIAVGFATWIRPLEGIIVAALLGLWIVAGAWRERFVPAAVMAAAAAVLASGQLAYNARLTGSAGLFPVVVYFDRYIGKGSNNLGFGPNRGAGWPIEAFPGHSPLEALVNADLGAFGLHTELFGWATGSLLPLALLVISRRWLRADAWMAASIVVIAAVQSLYWYHGGPEFGARYWFLMIVPLMALSARGILAAEDDRVRAGALLLAASALLVYFPWRATDKYPGYLHMSPEVARMAQRESFGRALVFVRGGRHPDFASAAVLNPIAWDEPVPVYAWEKDAATREAVRRRFPDRPVWTIAGPSVTGGGFRIVKRPTSQRLD